MGGGCLTRVAGVSLCDQGQMGPLSTPKVLEPERAPPQALGSQSEEGELWKALKEKLGFTGGRRAACAKAQRCGKAEFGVWGSRVMGALKAGVGRGQLRACTQETTEMSGWGMAMGPPPQMALA